MTVVNLNDIERRTTRLKDGPFDGQLTDRPDARMRKTQHAQGFRLPDKDQPWQPGMPEKDCRVRFAVYLWLCSDQRYCFVDIVDVMGEEQLQQALRVVSEG